MVYAFRMGRTNIEIDESLVRKARKLTRLKTKREIVDAALELLVQVKPCVSPAIPLLEPPAAYLARLKRRLEAIAAGNIGGTAPILSKWMQELEDVLRSLWGPVS